MANISINLERNAELHPDKSAVLFADKVLTYAELNAAANQVANGLKSHGIGKGDHVALSCPNVPYFPIIYFGVLKAGAVVIPINVLLKAPEIAYILKDSDAKAFFCFDDTPGLAMGAEGYAGFTEAGTCPHFFMMAADPTQSATIDDVETVGKLMQSQSPLGAAATVDATDTALILYTSGTTGKPKGAELTHANVGMNILVNHALVRGTASDVYLIVLPLSHCLAQIAQMNVSILGGGTIVLQSRFDPNAVLAAMRVHGVTIFAGVPTIYIALLKVLNLAGANERFDVAAIAARLRIGMSAGAAMPVEVMRQFEELFGIFILEGYGITETTATVAFNMLDFERVPGSVGKAIWGTQVRVVDSNGDSVGAGQEGEIIIHGHNVMKGYYKRPEATAEAIRDGWFYSGDVGKFDVHGNLFIVDRIKDMIIRGGFNVYPREVEEVLMTHDAVAQAAVIGVPHSTHGEEIKAVLMLKPGMSATPESLVTWAKERMAAYKYPRIVEIVEMLPMSATGKVLKRELRKV